MKDRMLQYFSRGLEKKAGLPQDSKSVLQRLREDSEREELDSLRDSLKPYSGLKSSLRGAAAGGGVLMALQSVPWLTDIPERKAQVQAEVDIRSLAEYLRSVNPALKDERVARQVAIDLMRGTRSSIDPSADYVLRSLTNTPGRQPYPTFREFRNMPFFEEGRQIAAKAGRPINRSRIALNQIAAHLGRSAQVAAPVAAVGAIGALAANRARQKRAKRVLR